MTYAEQGKDPITINTKGLVEVHNYK
jgi:hypothetical protein